MLMLNWVIQANLLTTDRTKRIRGVWCVFSKGVMRT